MNGAAISNGIRARQNEEANAAKLAAADSLYRKSKRLNLLKFSLAVIVPFALSWLAFFDGSGGAVFASFSYALSLASMALSFLLKPTIQKNVNLAADIKQDFDVSVYEMPWSKELFGVRRNLTKEIAENSAERFRNNGSGEFRDWYRPEADAMPLLQGIFACQRENYAWDSGLRKRYKNLCVVGIGALIMAVVGVEIIKNGPVRALLASLAYIAPILSWLLDTVGALNADLERLEEMKAAFQSADAQRMEDLQEIQKRLYEHRKGAVIPPGFLYRLFKPGDEEIARHTMEMESWGRRHDADSV